MRILLLLSLFLSALFSHGLFYSVHEDKAVIINANFTEKIPAAYASIVIYEGESAIPLLTSKLDSGGNFAFLPPRSGEYRVKISASSDHGSHDKEFSLNVDEGSLSGYKEPVYQKYLGILSVIGIIFGIFGIIVLIKSKKA
ncbi:hypothetical protein [Campylobacter sp. RM16187]|uniref:hypothetical protein n=1 Tax=Campylobacter sp. RM16187 TaxID=1660063 RepID=UPI0021B55D0C|nr:hypothetical protein [Campylobacter sp. RM16187]QKG28678.1 Co/Ni ABC transporter CbiKLMQO, membrane protein CbiL [Campylobacter sp. RM16187]